MAPLSPTNLSTEQTIEQLFAGEIEKLCEKEASFFDDDYRVSTTVSSVPPRRQAEPVSPRTTAVSIDAKNQEGVLDNIRRLIRRHSTKLEQLVYWCETSPLAIAKLLNNTQFCWRTTEKIAEYYQVTLNEIVSSEFKQKALDRSHPMPDSAIDEKKAKLCRIGKRIEALCHLGEVTDKQLAECCRCDEKAIAEIKKGVYPNFILIEKIAKLCKTMTSELANPNVVLPELSQEQQHAERLSAEGSQYRTAANICLLMDRHKITRPRLAKWCGCAASTISKAKNGSAHFPAVIKKIAGFFHLTVKQLAAVDFDEKYLAHASPSD